MSAVAPSSIPAPDCISIAQHFHAAERECTVCTDPEHVGLGVVSLALVSADQRTAVAA
jgi:hypothetical protein